MLSPNVLCAALPGAHDIYTYPTATTARIRIKELSSGISTVLLTDRLVCCPRPSRNIEWDAVETPSQMQEKWVYDKKTFNSFAKHWRTGQPVPGWMYEEIKGTIKYRKGMDHETHSKGASARQQHTLPTMMSMSIWHTHV